MDKEILTLYQGLTESDREKVDKFILDLLWQKRGPYTPAAKQESTEATTPGGGCVHHSTPHPICKEEDI